MISWSRYRDTSLGLVIHIGKYEECSLYRAVHIVAVSVGNTAVVACQRCRDYQLYSSSRPSREYLVKTLQDLAYQGDV